jgi:NAD(P)-dependent dehydrogenase (short-subunit alcohol dehydrogenase family)
LRTAVIGASRGLGLELTKAFLSRGHSVFAVCRRDPVPGELEDLREQYGPQLLLAPADVTDAEQMAQAALLVKQAWGELDALIHAAGILADSDRVNPLHQADIGDLRATLDVNVVGPVITVETFYPLIKKGVNAPFVIVTSEGCDIASAGSWIPAYALSKCAATKIASIMNQSVPDVRFIALHPGRIRTVMGRDTWLIEAAESAEGIVKLITEGQMGQMDSWYIDYLGQDMLREKKETGEAR